MPRALGVGRYGLAMFTDPVPQATPAQITLLQPPGGLDRQLRNNMYGRGVMRLVENLHVRDQHYKLRDGTTTVGDDAGSEVVYAVQYETTGGKRWTLRWTQNGVEYYKSSLWNNCAGVTVNANSATNLALTGWGDTLIFSTQVQRLYQIDFSGSSPLISELSPDSPERAIHLTAFAGRVIASARDGIYWSIRNDSTDWLGLGSGYEDLRSAPGGQVDQQTAVIPITDEYAYVVRSNSVWQMTQTGDFDAPFNFSRLYAGIGTPYPGTVTEVRQGVCFLSKDNVVFISPQGMREIGQRIRDDIRVESRYARLACGMFDIRNNEYVLSVPDGNALNACKVYRYSFDTDTWVRDIFPFPVRSMAFTRYSQGITIGELQGTIGGLSGPIGALGGGERAVGALYATGGASKRVIRDAPERNNEPARDVNSNGTPIASGFRIESGYIVKDRTIEKITVVEQMIEYEAEDDVDVTFEYSTDGGTTWQQYSSVSLPESRSPKVMAVRHTLERDNICLAMSSDQCPNFRMIAWHIFATNGAMVEDAR